MTLSKRTLISATVIVLSFSILFVCSCVQESSEGSAIEGGDTIMTEEEIIEANTKVITEHLDEIKYSERFRKHYYLARNIAGLLARCTDCRIITTVTSESVRNSGLRVTVVDEEGKTFIVGIGGAGSIDSVRDSDGKFLFAPIE